MKTEEAPSRGQSPAQLVVDFINSGDHSPQWPERFGEIADFNAWAAEHALLDDALVTASDLVAARELRHALRTVLLSHTDRNEVDQARLDNALGYLRQASVRYPLATVVAVDGVRLAAQGTGVPRLLGTVLAAATESAQAGDWTRMKGCTSPPCEQAFIDRTRNHSARYCTPGCASRATMRQSRQRRNNPVAS